MDFLPGMSRKICVYLRGKYQALMGAAALDAQLTALSTGACAIVKRPEKQGFSHEFMLHRSEFRCRCRARVYRDITNLPMAHDCLRVALEMTATNIGEEFSQQ